MNLLIKSLTFGLFLLVQGHSCKIDWSLISTKIPSNTGKLYLTETLKLSGKHDFGFIEMQLEDKCNGQDEHQKDVIRVKDGGHIKNLIVGPNAGNGIVCEGDCILENVHWKKVCEDAATFHWDAKNTSVMRIIGGSAYEAEDKVFQHNAPGKMILQNFYAKNIGKLTRSCGTCFKKVHRAKTFEISNVVVDGMKEAIIGVQTNMDDKVLTLKNVQVTNARKDNKGRLKAAICKTYTFNGSEDPKFDKIGPVDDVCEWNDDVTIS